MPTPLEKKDRCTLLLVKENGKTVTIRWFSAILTVCTVVFIGAVAAAGLFFFWYQQSENEKARLIRELSASKSLIASLRAGGASDKSLASPAVPGSSDEAPPANRSDPQNDAPLLDAEDVAATVSDDSSPGEAASTDTAVNGGNPPQAMEAESTDGTFTVAEIDPWSDIEKATSGGGSQPQVVLEDFASKYRKNNRRLEIRFRIKNTLDAGKLSGHVVVVLKPDTENIRKWAVLPEEVEIPSGRPTGEQQGQTFSIVNYKNVTFRLDHETEPERFKTASVFVFDDDGILMKEERFPIVLE